MRAGQAADHRERIQGAPGCLLDRGRSVEGEPRFSRIHLQLLLACLDLDRLGRDLAHRVVEGGNGLLAREATDVDAIDRGAGAHTAAGDEDGSYIKSDDNGNDRKGDQDELSCGIGCRQLPAMLGHGWVS